MKELEKAPEQSQRALSKTCGVSLGSVHYCLNALIEKGYVKAQNFKNAHNKLAYAYILTPSGINLKKELAIAFLRRKQAEYEALQQEITALEEDLARWRRCVSEWKMGATLYAQKLDLAGGSGSYDFFLRDKIASYQPSSGASSILLGDINSWINIF